MIKAVISVAVVVLVLYGGWELWLYWDKVSHDRDLEEKSSQVDPEQLQGMPGGDLSTTLRGAQKAGPAAFKEWLKRYGPSVQDPRRAWIELDYAVLIAREDPVEAKKVFADVKARTPESSPVYPRVKQLAKTYE